MKKILKAEVFKLVFYDMSLSYENYKEGFMIGLFSTFAKANQTAKHYQRNVQGFSDYPCDYLISPKNVIGIIDNIQKVFMVEGWNVNENLDEIDIVESDCFTDENTAKQELLEMKQNNDRSEWTLNSYTIDECLWKDGFVRV